MLKKIKNYKAEKCQWELRLQFKDGIQSLSDAISAGYSIENAFNEATQDLNLLYPGSADILKEFEWIKKQISLNSNVEELLLDFGRRSNVEDIVVFSEVLATAKRTGGDLIKIIHMTSDSIRDKTDVQREIRTLLASKQLEASIMSCIPVFIIFYLWICMPGFLEPMYTTPVGRSVMTISLLLYMGAVLLIRKIIDIRV